MHPSPVSQSQCRLIEDQIHQPPAQSRTVFGSLNRPKRIKGAMECPRNSRHNYKRQKEARGMETNGRFPGAQDKSDSIVRLEEGRDLEKSRNG